MPKNILIDINILLDVFLERPGYLSSRNLLEKGESQNRLYISAHAVTTMAYLLEKAGVPRLKILDHLNWVLQTFRVAAVDGVILKAATKSQIKDFEDAVMEQAALACSASTIVTRNVKDFKAGRVQALAPENFSL